MNEGPEATADDLSQIRNLIEVSIDCTDYSKLVDQQLDETTMTSAKSHLDTALPELIRELGYTFTANVDQCRANLRQLGGGPDIHAATVARIIGVMVRTHTGLDDPTTLQNMNATGTSLWEKDKVNEPKTWNMEVFIKAVHELQPTLHWEEIIYELDHPGFLIKDRMGLILLINALKLGFKVQGFQGPFPVDMLYRPWRNHEGQMTLFQQILRNPDVFNFGDHHHHAVAMEVLKHQPENMDNRELSSWKSLELIDTLLALAESGHNMAVQELFSFPSRNCPDVLTLGLMQINPPMTNFRRELLVANFQVFLGNHPNSGIIFMHAWSSTTIMLRPLIMRAMAEWYGKGLQEGDTEHARLSRVLDVAQELKALSMLLTSGYFPFVIDLAVLASRREYLNLDKWLADQMQEHGEGFVKAIAQYLQRKLPNILQGPLKEESLIKANLPKEAIGALLYCLQQVTSALNTNDLKESVLVMIQNSQPLLAQMGGPKSRPPGSGSAAPGTGPPVGPVRPTPRPPPPTLMQLSNVHQQDPLGGLTNQLGDRLNLGTAPVVSSAGMPSGGMSSGGSAFSALPTAGNFRNMAPSPGSPSRMFGAPGAPVPHTPTDGGSSPSLFNLGSNPAAATTATSSGTLEQMKASIRDISHLFPELKGPISKEVEDEANSYFQRIYNHPPHPTMSIDEVLDLLKKFQESNVQRELEVFNCVIKNLFEEYKYFPQYPEGELHITARLFGGIIEHGLVNLIPLGLALRFVLDAVRKTPDSKMYFFGIAALDRFKTRLKDYPQYCQHVSCIPHFREFPSHLIEWVEFGAQTQMPPNKPKGPVVPPQAGPVGPPGTTAPPGAISSTTTAPVTTGSKAMPSTSAISAPAPPTSVATSSTIVRPTGSTIGGRPSIANTTNIDTLLNAKQKSGPQESINVPNEKLQDKVSFIFNNLSLINMEQKKTDLSDALGEEHGYTAWLAQYLVMKRASIEPNFHTLYSSFLEKMGDDKLYDAVLKETFNNIRVLLSADKSIANFSDRSLLKNLGHWLGMITLARNNPILMVDLDFKPMVIEAYHNGQQELLYVVPFVAKVIESCAKSKVFKPPCPWTMGIMNLLSELHQEHGLKLNLKFEIEVLCKTLNIELHTLQPGQLLKDYDKLNQMAIRSFGVGQKPHPILAPPQAPPPTSGGRGMVTSTPMDPMSVGSMPMMATMMAGSHGPGSAGAGMGAALMATPQQQAIPPPQFMPPTSGQQPFNMEQTPAENAFSTGGQGAMPAFQHVAPVSTASGAGAAIAAQHPMRPVDPKFHFTDINTSNLNGIVPHITVDNRLTLLKDQPDLVQLIKIAIEKSIQEWATPVIERANKIALTTTEQIVKKDYSLDPDENRMRSAAHNMVRDLTSGMAMITCRDHLLQSIKNHLKHFMVTLGRNLTQQQTEAIETTVTVIASDNVELACAFIQKKAIEKAILEVDKRLKMEYEQRLVAKKEGRRYYDQVAMTYQQERMPEHIKLKVGGASSQQSAVYDEFARNVPGFKPLTERELLSILPMATPEMRVGNNAPAVMSSAAPGAPGTGAPPGSTAAGTATSQPQPQQPPTAQLVTSEECVAILDEVYSKVEPFVTQCNTLPTNPHMANLRTLVGSLALARNSKEVSHVVILINKAVEALLEGLTPHIQPVETESLARYRDANLLVLRALADDRAYGLNWTKSRVTAALVEARDDIKYNPDAVDCFIRSGMVNLFEYDKHLATAVGEGNNVIALTFAMHLCKMYLIDDRSNAHIIEADLFGTIEALQKIATHSPRPPEGMVHLMEMIKMSSERLEQSLAMSGPTAQLHSGIAQAKEFEDPPGLLEKTEYLLREWVNAYHSRDAGKDSRQAFIVFVQLMNQHGILKTDDLITRFFRMSTQMCVDLCYRALSEPNNSPTLVRAKCFHTLDAYVRLITLLVKHSGETQNTVTKVNLLNKVLGIVAGVLLIDHEVRQTNFQQVPYHRIFIMLFLELNSPDAILENINFQVLTAYCDMLHMLRPAKAPGFAFAWLEVVSHRVFLGRILAQTAGQKGWPMFAQLLVDLFKFLSPFLRNAELAKPVHRLYRGTLRVLLVLLHDFPEFLCDYHYSFCDVIPPNCIQMRNLILSAFPRNMRLPDPFTPNLKVELLPEISIAPRTVSNYAAMLKPNFKKDLDSYLKNRSPVAFVSDLRGQLQVSNGESPGNRYNIQLINALVMYVGTSAIQYLRTKGLTPTMSAIAHTSHMDIFQNLAVDLDTEGRYLFLNCIANQLRYPNSHTQYFSCTLLYLFAEANQESIQEQITRVLLERLIVNRPHPWGLLITFIELIKNRNYNFWSHEFVQCAPEIQKLFESVARSCMVHSPPRMDNHGQPVPAAPGTGSNPQLGLTNEQQQQQQQQQQQN